jgi:hypothetical protein
MDVTRSFCDHEYDEAFVSSYLKGRSTKLNCLTFVGAVLERIGALPPSDRPVKDYAPGAFSNALCKRGGFKNEGAYFVE